MAMNRVLPSVLALSLLVSNAMAATPAAKTTATPLKLTPTTEAAAIDTSKFATKQDINKLTNAILEVYAKLATLERQNSAGGGGSGQSSQVITQLYQQVAQLQSQLNTIQATQNEIRASIAAIHVRMQRLDGAKVTNP